MGNEHDRRRDQTPTPARQEPEREIERKRDSGWEHPADRGTPTHGNDTTVDERNPIPARPKRR